jgi:hypothetical protein
LEEMVETLEKPWVPSWEKALGGGRVILWWAATLASGLEPRTA